MSTTQEPRLECDLVMKGGITSGVIYPGLIAKLSETYRFRSIGGTSAGAIAAAAAAAAQLGVHARTNPNAFRRLEQLPEELGQPVPGRSASFLLTLFQPQKKLKRHFRLLLAALNSRSTIARVLRIAIAAVFSFPIGALLGALPGVILLLRSWGAGWILSLIVTTMGLIVGALVSAVISFGRRLPRNHFGICNGMPASARKMPPASLTPWLHGYLNELAGKQGTAPLTFGDLWRGHPNSTDDPGAASKVVDLAMMTTALNLARPYRIPFDTGDIYYIDEELAALLPVEVMAWLRQHARASATATALSREAKTFRAFPAAEDFPVVLGVRMSLSFPILLSAVPLYTVDRTLDVNKAAPTQATRVYFSDGGISSNFPVHFFDSPLPSRPTFAINLKDFHPDHPDQRVFLPEMLKNNAGLKRYVPPLAVTPGWGSIVGFVAAILDTMQNWRDSLQLAMPGFRDRIVHISHSSSEGGMNLNMPAEVIRTLAASGMQAAEALLAAFAIRNERGEPNGWDNHRRIRARALLAALQQQLDAIAAALADPRPPPYDHVVTDPDPPSYPFAHAADAQQAVKLLHELARLSGDLVQAQVDLSAGAPRPAPEIRIVPRM
jgi:predicted acylesterase/phospholipase RssA